jgi:hypothetical protein
VPTAYTGVTEQQVHKACNHPALNPLAALGHAHLAPPLACNCRSLFASCPALGRPSGLMAPSWWPSPVAHRLLVAHGPCTLGQLTQQGLRGNVYMPAWQLQLGRNHCHLTVLYSGCSWPAYRAWWLDLSLCMCRRQSQPYAAAGTHGCQFPCGPWPPGRGCVVSTHTPPLHCRCLLLLPQAPACITAGVLLCALTSSQSMASLQPFL